MVLTMTADGAWVEQRAVSGPIHGRDFLVVLVCDDEEWRSAIEENREPETFPWPASAVKVFDGNKVDA